MKIAILTLPLDDNFGGILQAFALQTKLERMGHEVGVYNKFITLYKRPLWLMPLIWLKRFVFKYILRISNVNVFSEQDKAYEKKIINTYTRQFVLKYIHEIPFQNVVRGTYSGENAIVVGSDQIWRKKYYHSVTGDKRVENAYLEFAKDWDIKRIAYAPSFGTDQWEMTKAETQKCKKLIQKFDSVSVREDSGVLLCSEYLGYNAIQMIDPTLLFNADEYLEMIDCSKYIGTHNNTIMSYVLDENDETDSLLKQISERFGIGINKANVQYENADIPINKRIQPPVENWLASFSDAKFVITDSFHACVFSILFKKPFVVVGNATRGQARFTSLLKLFGLEDHVVDVTDVDLISQILTKENNWVDIYKKLSSLRNKSEEFLKKSL